MRVTLLVDESSAPRAVPLVARLRQVDGLQVTRAEDPACIHQLAPGDVLVALIDAHPLPSRDEHALAAHLDAGGGLVLLGGTLHAWRDATTLTGLVGKPGERQLRTELVVEVLPHPALRRLDAQVAVADHAWLDAAVPPEAEPWLRTTWHFREQVLAWSLGRSVALTLGAAPEACADERFAHLVLRAVRHAAGLAEPAPLRVGMLGYGAIGAEHAAAIAAVEGLELAAVCDRDPVRLAQVGEACPQARLLRDADELGRDDGVDLVVVSVPPHRHAEAAIALLHAGKHVVVEKPFALTTAEADAVIAAAAEARRSLTVYQNRRWDPDFRAVRDCVRSRRIGEVFHIETFVGSFAHPCRYWHSHEPVSGGVVFDWGSHYLDWILQLVDEPVTAVTGTRHKRVWHDVSNADMARVGLRFAGGQEAEFVHSDIAAAPKPKWYVLGTEGALTVTGPDAEATVRVHLPDGNGATHVETLALPPALDAPFHRNLADHLLCGEPLAVSPDEARRTTAVLEAAALSALDGGPAVMLR